MLSFLNSAATGIAMPDLEHPDLSLETGFPDFSALVSHALTLLGRYNDDIRQGSFAPFQPMDAGALQSAAELGLPAGWDDLKLWDLCTQGVNANHPGYMADIPGGGLLLSALGDLLTSGVNRWPGLYPGAPGLLEIEKNLLLWMCSMFGMPEGAGGVFTSGGSLANFSAVHVARVNLLSEQTASRAVIYASDQCHHSVVKAARMAGFYDSHIVSLPTDALGRTDLQALRDQLATDVAADRVPFFIVASAGTTRTGAVDDLPAMRRLADDYGCWLHVDAAWAGSFVMTERGRSAMAGIGEADSITIDPHKAFWTAWGSGALLVKQPATLKAAFDVDADYLPFADADELMLNPSVISPELSRNARGLQLWLPLKLAGEQAFVNCLNEKLDLAEWAAETLRPVPALSVPDWPLLGICCFALGSEADVAAANHLTQQLIDTVNEDGRVVISGAHLHGRLYARLAPLQFKTHKEHVATALALITQAVEQLTTEVATS